MKKITMIMVLLLLTAMSYGQTIYEQVAALKDSVEVNISNKTVLNKVKAVDEGRMMSKTLGIIRNLRDSIPAAMGTLNLSQVLLNGNTTVTPILLKVPGTLNKTCVNITTGTIIVQDTTGINYLRLFQPFGGGVFGPRMTFGYNSGSNALIAQPTDNWNDTLPNKSGVFALTSDTRYEVISVGDSSYTLSERKCGGVVLMLSTVTASRNLALFQANKCPGCHIEVHNANASAYDWTFITNIPKAADGTNITAMTDETWYMLVSDGSNWWRTN